MRKETLSESLTYSVEFARVVITVENADYATENLRIGANGEVVWHEGVAVALQDDLAFEEGTLGHASVGLLGLRHHD